MTTEDDLRELEGLLVTIAAERTKESPALFDDALQEAMIGAWERLEQGHSKGIAIHKARQAATDVVRGRRMTGSKAEGRGVVDSHTKATSLIRQSGDSGGEEYVIEPSDPGADHAIEQIDARQALGAALSALQQHERYLLWMFFYEGRTQAEIGREFGLTSQAISLRLKKILARLRVLFVSDMLDPE